MNILVVYLQQIWGIQAIVTQYFVFLFYWIAFWQQFASRLYNLPKSEENCFEEKYSLAILSFVFHSLIDKTYRSPAATLTVVR